MVYIIYGWRGEIYTEAYRLPGYRHLSSMRTGHALSGYFLISLLYKTLPKTKKNNFGVFCPFSGDYFCLIKERLPGNHLVILKLANHNNSSEILGPSLEISTRSISGDLCTSSSQYFKLVRDYSVHKKKMKLNSVHVALLI